MHAKFVFGSGQQFLEEFTLKNFQTIQGSTHYLSHTWTF